MPEILESLVHRTAELFLGAVSHYGEFLPYPNQNGGKNSGKCTTKKEPVGYNLWLLHLQGERGLGIVPINEESQCRWGAIDIDDYNLDFRDLLKKTKETALVACRSKSGGAHLYVFFKDFVPARTIRDYLRSLVSGIGLAGCEIFPKQNEIDIANGDIGNWINMPYFGGLRTGMVLDDSGRVVDLSLSQFLDLAESKRTEGKGVKKIQKSTPENDIPLGDGPVCLQIMLEGGFPEGTRNVSLLNIGTYFKKSHPGEWESLTRNFNVKIFGENRLKDREVEDIIRSLRKKDYNYQCQERPLCDFCNANLCGTRKFGISSNRRMPVINKVTKIRGDSAVWLIETDEGRMALTSGDLLENRRFREKCLNDLSLSPDPLSPIKWSAYVRTLISQAIEVENEGMFVINEIPGLFQKYVVSRTTDDKSKVGEGRVWYDQDNGAVRFQIDLFQKYLLHQRVNIQKGVLLNYFSKRDSKEGVGKTKGRTSFRYSTVKLNEEDIIAIEEKRKGDDEVL